MHIFVSLVAGLVFGLGLVISGLANPVKVLGFLDVAGRWDPSLAFVMGGAVAVGAVAFALARKRTASLLGLPIQVRSDGGIDARLAVGSLLFGIGWGLVGLCPGPAIAALGIGGQKALVFFTAMVAGMAIFELLEHRKFARAGAA